MAIGIRSVTVGTNDGSSATVSVTTSETPSATQVGDLVVVIHGNDFYALSNMATPTATGSPTFNAISGATADGGTNLAHVKAYWYVANTAGAQVIQTTETGSHDEEKVLVAYVLSGADTTTPVDAAGNNTGAAGSANQDCPSVSPSTTDAFLICHNNSGGGSASSSYTSPGSMTERYDQSFGGESLVGATEQLSASGATGVRTFTCASANPAFAAVSIAIKTASAASGVPWTPPRLPQYRDPGETWWLQPKRLDQSPAAAANDLAQPLFQPADGRYWHLYNDVAERPYETYQRAYISDPSLLAPTGSDPLTTPPPPRTLQLRDPGETYWTQRRPPDPTLLSSALLENELLGGADVWRHGFAAWYDRREVPQQRAYVSDPLLLTTALLEDPLLSGQPDRTLAAHVDRREVPQQRPYISDPSFYPSVAPTDPLTLAYGGGGHYWLLYNHAGIYTDRREVPQQRQYESVPGLLATALLEDPLLGQGDVARHQTWFTDRKPFPQQRRYVSEPTLLSTALLEDPLLGGEVLVHRMWFTDRRLVPQQPPRYDPPPALADPVFLLGEWLKRYLTPATHRDRRQTVPERLRLDFAGSPAPAVFNATSTPTVVAVNTSTGQVVAVYTSTAAVTANRTSTSTVSDG